MASLNLEPEELKVIEQLRVRLSLLSTSIQSLRDDVVNGNPLPSALEPSLLLALRAIPLAN